MTWIFLSPHLDDAVLSCGGMIYDLIQNGSPVQIWTIFAGDPPPGGLSPFAQLHHERWQTGQEAAAARRAEDQRACARLGAVPRYWVEPDCIYRRLPDGSWLIHNRDDLFSPVHPFEAPLVARLADWLARHLTEYRADNLPPGGESQLVAPLTLGGHVDHRVVRAAAESLQRPLFYYADYPYAVIDQTNLADCIQPEWEEASLPVSEAGLAAWQAAVAAYTSQISTFWANEEAMKADLRQYWAKGGGSRLWRSAGGEKKKG